MADATTQLWADAWAVLEAAGYSRAQHHGDLVEALTHMAGDLVEVRRTRDRQSVAATRARKQLGEVRQETAELTVGYLRTLAGIQERLTGTKPSQWLVEGFDLATPAHRLYLDLKGARERVCRAQVHFVTETSPRIRLQDAVDAIDQVASIRCPQWSADDMPERLR